MVGVADGNRKGVGGILRRLIAHPEQGPDHVAYLPLLSAAAADDGLLDLGWGVFGDRQSGEDAGGDCGAAGMAELKGGVRIAVDEYALEHDLIRLVLSDDVPDALVDFPEAFGQVCIAAQAQSALSD